MTEIAATLYEVQDMTESWAVVNGFLCTYERGTRDALRQTNEIKATYRNQL